MAGVDRDQVDLHLAGCPACRAWATDVDRVRRTVRLRPAVEVPDLSSRILAAVPSPPKVDGRRRSNGGAGRALLGAVAAAQLLLGLAQLVGLDRIGDVSAGEGMHLFDESTAWNIAVGVAFAVGAVWPRRCGGLLPVLTVFVAVLAVESAIDLAAGRAVLLRETSHLLVVVGVVLLWVVAWPYQRRPRPKRRQSAGPVSAGNAGGDDTQPVCWEPGDGRRVRPAGRHVA